MGTLALGPWFDKSYVSSLVIQAHSRPTRTRSSKVGPRSVHKSNCPHLFCNTCTHTLSVYMVLICTGTLAPGPRFDECVHQFLQLTSVLGFAVVRKKPGPPLSVKSCALPRSSKIGPQCVDESNGPHLLCYTRMCVCVCVWCIDAGNVMCVRMFVKVRTIIIIIK